MKRVGHLFERVVALPNLLAAWRRARRGKRGRASVERFARRLEPELFRLQEELASGAWRPGRPVTFRIHDPKERVICVAPFRDRVVHHALIGAIQPHLERGFDADSYGCRLGKGTDGALRRAQTLARRHPYCLKTDVAAFFASVHHDLVITQLARLFKDRRLLALVETIVRAGGEQGCGLPLGNLTSQWFANLFLTPLDRYLRAHATVRGQIRYMDDVLAFGHGPSELRALAEELERWLLADRHLTLKRAATQVYATRTGAPFLGFRVGSRGLRIRRPTWRRFVQRLRRAEWEYRQGRRTASELAASVRSMLAHLDRVPTVGLRRRLLATRRAVET